uniref:Uncharacterized protein n=1 Tax=Ciona savignyi TaxID=51511 RepID=H2YED2_CIOSA
NCFYCIALVTNHQCKNYKTKFHIEVPMAHNLVESIFLSKFLIFRII